MIPIFLFADQYPARRHLQPQPRLRMAELGLGELGARIGQRRLRGQQLQDRAHAHCDRLARHMPLAEEITRRIHPRHAIQRDQPRP